MGNVPANMAYFGGYELGRAVVPPGLGIAGDMAVGAVAQARFCVVRVCVCACMCVCVCACVCVCVQGGGGGGGSARSCRGAGGDMTASAVTPAAGCLMLHAETYAPARPRPAHAQFTPTVEDPSSRCDWPLWSAGGHAGPGRGAVHAHRRAQGAHAGKGGERGGGTEGGGGIGEGGQGKPRFDLVGLGGLAEAGMGWASCSTEVPHS